MAQLTGYKMSWRQLDEIWKYDNEMARLHLNIPLRSCTAVPSEGGHPPLTPEELNSLKRAIREMWVRASLHLEAFKIEEQYEDAFGDLHDVGWGLRVREGEPVSFPGNRFTVFGWLASVPESDSTCPTAHRYLRSPAEGNLYLGGPIGMLNFSKNETVSVRSQKSAAIPRCFHAVISTRGLLTHPTELVWNYGMRGDVPLFDYEHWHLAECCETVAAPSEPQEVPPLQKLKPKKPRLSSSVPKKSRLIKVKEQCNYCGRDLWEVIDEKTKTFPTAVNLKRHIATHHALQVCIDSGLKYNNEIPSEGLKIDQFLIELQKITEPLHILKSYGYKVVPASQFLKYFKLPPKDKAMLSEQEQAAIFSDFQKEARRVYEMYDVIHLRGSLVPVKYEDLLPLAENTNYKNIAWLDGKRPGTQNFSAVSYLNKDESAALASEVQTHVQMIVDDCQNM